MLFQDKHVPHMHCATVYKANVADMQTFVFATTTLAQIANASPTGFCTLLDGSFQLVLLCLCCLDRKLAV